MSASSRRDFVIRLASVAAVASSGVALSACGGDGGEPPVFNFGVSSGDPLADRVILWTHAQVPGLSEDVALTYEVATDASFTTLVSSGSTKATAATGHTAKADATGLAAGKDYFFRFRSGDTVSPVGRTRTLPAAGSTSVSLAVFSCSNYPAGYFNVYAEAAKSGAQFAVHLGDFIYEYGAGGYASTDAKALGRVVEPANECLSLADYRKRYAQYRSDPDSKVFSASLPLIAVWDDHEVANDTYKDGAENHTATTEGSFAARRAAAIQAWHEWMPVRAPDASNLMKIYRSFDFGGLAALHMLDTRVIGRDKQVEFAELLNPATAATAQATLASTSRTIMGSTQLQWLQGQLAASKATWQVLGQQVLMGRMNIPAPILVETIQPGAGVTVSQYAAIVAKAQTAPATLTAAEKAILAQPSIPYNLDAWDGYQAARETVLGTARSLGKNLVVLSGDTHNAWANELADMGGNAVGVEFATSSVSSPGFEEYLPQENPAMLAGAFQQLIKTLKYCDTARRGYMLLTATATECRADWVYVNTITSRNYTASTDKSLKVLAGVSGRGRIVAA